MVIAPYRGTRLKDDKVIGPRRRSALGPRPTPHRGSL